LEQPTIFIFRVEVSKTLNYWEGRFRTGLTGTSAPERNCFLKAERAPLRVKKVGKTYIKKKEII
jgi:hypothetical protein